MIDTLVGLSFIVFMVLGGIWYNARKRKTTSKVTGRYVLYSLGVLIILLFVSAGTSSSSNNDSATVDESSSSKKVSQSSSSKSENNVLEDLSNKELKEYNSGLIDSLSEEQKWASDGKDSYNAALYIDNLKYDSNRGLLVYVTDEFSSLKDDGKTAVGQHAQKMANAQLSILGKDVASESLPSTSIYQGAEKVGRSTSLSGSSKFKWFKA